MELLTQIQPWHWLSVGLILLGLETLGIGGFLIGAGVAALLQGVTLWIFPEMSWQIQLSVFAADAVLFTWLYFKLFKGFNNKTDQPEINDRASHMVGQHLVLVADLPAGQNKLQFGDTLWKVNCDEALKQGDSIKVTGGSGMELKIEKI